MKSTAAIRLLTTSTNDKGDLFTRLMTDLFYALGYDNLKLDVQKIGREIDIQGEHRHAPRLLMAECKAHIVKMGGRELNTFFGAVTRERIKAEKNDLTVDAYFISLGGFTETGREQEIETGSDGIILFDSKRVVEELELARLLVSDAKAAALAGQCLQAAGVQGLALAEIELLGHETGYVKAVYFEQNKQLTHFALIHADGNSLAESVAREVIADDKASGGILHTLHYLAPLPSAPDHHAQVAHALDHYKRWLGEECGSIQLDGLPTDSDLGPRKLELERLFVPLHVTLPEEMDRKEMPPTTRPKVHQIGELLTEAAHIAILASPGGGKSTLLKRLAIAYAFPERRAEIDDHLPKHDWTPLFLRCRELQNKVVLPILSLLDDIPVKAEMSTTEANAFREGIQEALQAGRILLLIDGLDEISQEGARVTFANNLRSFLAVFPQTALVVTSREAGFRLVAGTIAGMCRFVRLAPFTKKDINSLCVKWLTEVENDSKQVRTGALQLAKDIWENERIRALAENPLLLTTLLVVKRWIGELPRNRAALYGVAVQVLVRTWNVEGYEPLDEQETLAQLSYIACAMMEQGIQRIAHNSLLKLLEEARQELEAELQFVAVSPSRFIERVESRSSLLMQSGRVLENGELQPVYEFRHLTFQEYLAARGYAKEQHPHRNEDIPFVNLLVPHFTNERWKEVIPLAAVLAERKATESTVKKLIELCGNPGPDEEKDNENKPYADLLLNCILDEVKLTSNTLIAALKTIALFKWHNILTDAQLVKLKSSKVADLMLSTIEYEYLSGKENWQYYAIALADLYYGNGIVNTGSNAQEQSAMFAETTINELLTGDRRIRVRAAFRLMQYCFSNSDARTELYRPNASDEATTVGGNVIFSPSQVERMHQGLNKMLSSEDWPTIMATVWALAWAGLGLFYQHKTNEESVELLIERWYHSFVQEGTSDVNEFIAWAIANSGLFSRDSAISSKIRSFDFDKHLKKGFAEPNGSTRTQAQLCAAVILGWYSRSPWTDEELVSLVKEAYQFNQTNSIDHAIRTQDHAFTILSTLGELGQRAMEEQVSYLEVLGQTSDTVDDTVEDKDSPV